MLTGPQQKFAEGIALGLSATEAYQAAYPDAKASSAKSNAGRLMTNDDVQAEVMRIRRAAEVLAGGAVLTLAMKRQFFHDVVTTPIGKITPDSILCQKYTHSRQVRGRGEEAEEWETEKIEMPDKIKAIIADNDLGGDGVDANLAITITRAWK